MRDGGDGYRGAMIEDMVNDNVKMQMVVFAATELLSARIKQLWEKHILILTLY